MKILVSVLILAAITLSIIGAFALNPFLGWATVTGLVASVLAAFVD